MRVLVTGANGFVGGAISDYLAGHNFSVVRGQRSVSSAMDGVIGYGDLEHSVGWGRHLTGVDAIVHCAGYASCHSDKAAKERCWAVNVDATLSLARAAATVGVKRFIYMSTAQVLGDKSPGLAALDDESPPAPASYYAETKLKAEQGLLTIAKEGGLDVVLLRPPLIYGPGSKSNFLRLVEWIDKGRILPLGRADEPRSMIYVGNLGSAVAQVLTQSDGPTGAFLICDGNHLSTRDSCIRIGVVLGRPARLFAVQPRLVLGLSRLVGWHSQIARLFSAFVVKAERFSEVYDWQAPYSVDDGLRDTLSGWKVRS